MREGNVYHSQDADRAERSRDQNREDSQSENLLTHRLPLLLAVLDAVVEEHGAQGGLDCSLWHPGERHEDLLLVVERPARHSKVGPNHPASGNVARGCML